MARKIYLRYTLPEEIDETYNGVCDELVVEDLFDGGVGLEILPPSAIKDCPCSQFMELHGRAVDEVHQLKRIIAEKDAEIERLRNANASVAVCRYHTKEVTEYDGCLVCDHYVMEDEIERLRNDMQAIASCAGAPDPVDALMNVVALAKGRCHE